MMQKKPFFILEVSSNHNQDIERCYKFIDVAADIGADAVKFQLFQIDKLFTAQVLENSKEHRLRKRWELPISFIPKLSLYAKKKGIQFSCTPFYLEAVDELFPYVDFYKIASYELLWTELIKKCSLTGLPLILSTGMANMDEILTAVQSAKKSGCKDLTLLHCVSKYPAPPSECNLSAIKTIRDKTKCSVGWSDHSVDPFILYRAVTCWGATCIEFHLDIDGKGEEFTSGHCWVPYEIQKIISLLKYPELVDGSGIKEPAECEYIERDWRADPSDGLRPLKILRPKQSS